MTLAARRTILNASWTHSNPPGGVLITGCARSGTSYLGRGIGTLAGAEYFFEPQEILTLLEHHLVGDLPMGLAARMIGRTVREGLLVDALLGRRLNLRANDESSARRYLLETEIDRRLSGLGRRDVALRHLEDVRVTPVVKMPDVVGLATGLVRETPGLHAVIILRRAPDVVRSMVARGWWTDESLGAMQSLVAVDARATPVPCTAVLTEEQAEQWDSAKPVERALMAWCSQASAAVHVLEDEMLRPTGRLLVCEYESVVGDAAGALRWFGTRLGLESSELSERWVSEARNVAGGSGQEDFGWPDGISGGLREEAEDLTRRIRESSSRMPESQVFTSRRIG